MLSRVTFQSILVRFFLNIKFETTASPSNLVFCVAPECFWVSAGEVGPRRPGDQSVTGDGAACLLCSPPSSARDSPFLSPTVDLPCVPCRRILSPDSTRVPWCGPRSAHGPRSGWRLNYRVAQTAVCTPRTHESATGLWGQAVRTRVYLSCRTFYLKCLLCLGIMRTSGNSTHAVYKQLPTRNRVSEPRFVFADGGVSSRLVLEQMRLTGLLGKIVVL